MVQDVKFITVKHVSGKSRNILVLDEFSAFRKLEAKGSKSNFNTYQNFYLISIFLATEIICVSFHFNMLEKDVDSLGCINRLVLIQFGNIIMIKSAKPTLNSYYLSLRIFLFFFLVVTV